MESNRQAFNIDDSAAASPVAEVRQQADALGAKVPNSRC